MDGVAGFLVEKVLPAAVSGAGGVLVAAIRFKKSLTDRILILEQRHPQIEQKADAASVAATAATAGVSASISRYKRIVQRLKSRVSALQMRVSVLETVNNKLNNDVHEFIKEQNEQWAIMNRTLGQLEGEARKRSATSGQYPGTPK